MKVSFIGSGNVATHLAPALKKVSGVEIVQIISKDKGHAKNLAMKVKADHSHELSRLRPNFDLLIISVGDDSLSEIIEQAPLPDNKIICHTAGSVPSEIFSKASRKYGAIYPLQTFSKNKDINWYNVPIFITGSDEHTEKRLLHLAKQISGDVRTITDNQRFALHIAAVYSCNFTNAILTISQEICQRNELDFDLLKPLIDETMVKVWQMGPKQAQTGPAKRGDATVIDKHIEYLSDQGKEKELYQLLSDYIRETQLVK